MEETMSSHAPIFMIVAGELSGDSLGAGLMWELKKLMPEAQFFGIGGPLMLEAGLESLEPLESLSIMGLVEVVRYLPRLLALKSRLVREAKKRQPLAFIGIDSPDFNLRVAKALSKKSITKTVQYVSPSLWVWREGRAKTIKKYINRVLCLFPFEVDIYQKYHVNALCVGHRLGDEIPLIPDLEGAKKTLGLSDEHSYLAVLPGSRQGEVTRLLPFFLESLAVLATRHANLYFIIPAANPRLFSSIKEALDELNHELRERIILRQGEARLVMEASQAVLLASGTASLEAMLLKKPMVVAYRFSDFTAWLAPKIVKIKHFSLPNILAGKELVPELFQGEVTVSRLVEEVETALAMTNENSVIEEFYQIHKALRLGADKKAAHAVWELVMPHNE